MILESHTFKNNEDMPNVCSSTPKGKNISPHFSWKGAPQETKTYAIIIVDKAIPFFPIIHWVVYNIPVEVNELPEAMNKHGLINSQIKEGKNWTGEIGYYGPNPIGGKHRYEIKLYALNCIIQELGLDSKTFLAKYKGNIIAEQSMTGYYSKN